MESAGRDRRFALSGAAPMPLVINVDDPAYVSTIAELKETGCHGSPDRFAVARDFRVLASKH